MTLARRNTLDALDKRLLVELDENSRRTISQLARLVRQSRERTEYRFERLKSEGLVESFGATVNPARFGYSMYKTFLRLENNRPVVAELIEHMRAHPRMAWFALCDGSWDLCLCLYARNAEEFYRMHVELLSRFNPVILNFSSYSLIHVKMYKHGFTANRKRSGYRPLGGHHEALPVDEMDIKIVQMLLADGRRSVTDIATRLDRSIPTIQARIDRLEREEIVTGYRVNLSLAKLGLMFIKTQIFLRNYELSLTRQFEEFCDEAPYITCYTTQIGDCNIEIEWHVPSFEVYASAMEEIRGRYAKLIRNFQTLIIRDSCYSWLPKDILTH